MNNKVIDVEGIIINTRNYSDTSKIIDILTKEYVMDEFESFKAQIPESSFEKEVERWREIPGAEITQISDFLDFRISFVDKFMNNLYNVEK